MEKICTYCKKLSFIESFNDTLIEANCTNMKAITKMLLKK